MAYQKFPSEVYPSPSARPSAPPYPSGVPYSAAPPYSSEVPYPGPEAPQYMHPYSQPPPGCEGHCIPPPHPPPPFYPPPPPHGHAGYPPYSYQGYFNDGLSCAAPRPPSPPCYHEHYHHHESESESEDDNHFCSSCVKGCLAALCCCCLFGCL